MGFTIPGKGETLNAPLTELAASPLPHCAPSGFGLLRPPNVSLPRNPLRQVLELVVVAARGQGPGRSEAWPGVATGLIPAGKGEVRIGISTRFPDRMDDGSRQGSRRFCLPCSAPFRSGGQVDRGLAGRPVTLPGSAAGLTRGCQVRRLESARIERFRRRCRYAAASSAADLV